MCTHVNKCTLCISLSLSNIHTHRQLQSDLIFTLINSINKACRGRIYTHDYIGLIKKEEEEAGEGGKITKREEERWEQTQAGNRQPGADTHRH